MKKHALHCTADFVVRNFDWKSYSDGHGKLRFTKDNTHATSINSLANLFNIWDTADIKVDLAKASMVRHHIFTNDLDLYPLLHDEYLSFKDILFDCFPCKM